MAFEEEYLASTYGNQTMKLGQLIEHNMRNNFEKSFAKCGWKTIPRPFSKKSKLSKSLDQKFRVLYSFFLRWKLPKYIETKLQTTCFYLM